MAAARDAGPGAVPHGSQARPAPAAGHTAWERGSSLLLSKAPAEGSRGQALGPRPGEAAVGPRRGAGP